jgi:tetraacyldisaccharide 4'-kinase
VTLLEALGWPASLLFGGVARLRVWCHRRSILRTRRLDSVVISVGNLTVGGTGKTPMVIWLAERLIARGKRVGVLTRGYRGFLGHLSRDVPSAQLGYHKPELVYGDEVCLLLRRLPARPQFMIGVGANRYTRGRELEQQGVELFVLDDGFQHLQLARDVDIVLLDAADPFGGGHLLPAGRLREPKSALARADMVVITRSNRAPAVETIVQRHTDATIFYAQTKLEGISRVMGIVVTPEPDWAAKKLFAFCGIGNPSAFFEDLRRWGLQATGTASFRDHHHYSQSDADELEHRALLSGAEALVCTEKDVFNLLHAQFHRLPICSAKISLKVADADEFMEVLMNLVREKRSQAVR